MPLKIQTIEFTVLSKTVRIYWRKSVNRPYLPDPVFRDFFRLGAHSMTQVGSQARFIAKSLPPPTTIASRRIQNAGGGVNVGVHVAGDAPRVGWSILGQKKFGQWNWPIWTPQIHFLTDLLRKWGAEDPFWPNFVENRQNRYANFSKLFLYLKDTTLKIWNIQIPISGRFHFSYWKQ